MEIQASEFKARCLALLDRVQRTGEPITVLKRGRPVAQIVPVVPRGDRSPQMTLQGSVEIIGDILEPVLPPEAWEAERRPE
jgi:prevent-host-death family protein